MFYYIELVAYSYYNFVTKKDHLFTLLSSSIYFSNSEL